LKVRPKNSSYRLFYRNNVWTLAQSYLGLGDHARIAASADEMARFAYDPPNDNYLAACFLSRCVPLADKDAKLDEDKRKELKERYADRALELLRLANLGYLAEEIPHIEHEDVKGIAQDCLAEHMEKMEELNRHATDRYGFDYSLPANDLEDK